MVGVTKIKHFFALLAVFVGGFFWNYGSWSSVNSFPVPSQINSSKSCVWSEWYLQQQSLAIIFTKHQGQQQWTILLGRISWTPLTNNSLMPDISVLLNSFEVSIVTQFRAIIHKWRDLPFTQQLSIFVLRSCTLRELRKEISQNKRSIICLELAHDGFKWRSFLPAGYRLLGQTMCSWQRSQSESSGV